MTALEWQAQMTINAATSLSHWIKTTHPDRLNWAPSTSESVGTRGALTLAHECISANNRLAAILKGDSEKEVATVPVPTTAAEAENGIMGSARDVAEAIRGLNDDDLGKTYQTGLGPRPGSFVVALPAIHMTYHGGQINLIQLLYGDKEFHVPGAPNR